MALDLVGWNTVLDSDRADELSVFYEKLLGWTRFKGEEYTVSVSYTHLDVYKRQVFASYSAMSSAGNPSGKVGSGSGLTLSLIHILQMLLKYIL